MKKILNVLGAAFLLGSSVSTLAQGTIVFNNSELNLVFRWTSLENQTLIPVPVGGGFVQLAYAVDVGIPVIPYSPFQTQASWLTSNPSWTFSKAVGFTAPGRFDGGTVRLEFVTAGANAQYGVFAWTGNATTFDEALSAGFGTYFTGFSGVFTTATGGAGTPGSPPVSLADTFPGMSVGMIIPEPSTFALTCLGAAGMWIGRRRK